MDNLNPDSTWVISLGPVALNATIIGTWIVMLVLTLLSWLVTRRLTSAMEMSPGQNLLEAVVDGIQQQISEITNDDPDPYLTFVGSLFLFIAFANLLSLVPGFLPPVSSLSATAALATCVFFAVHIYGVGHQGWLGYLKTYTQPTIVMLPFNIIGELSRTLALTIRLFGNMMSGVLIVGILLSLAPLLFPILVQIFGLLMGMIQAYIFAVLAMVYIAAAVRARQQPEPKQPSTAGGGT